MVGVFHSTPIPFFRTAKATLLFAGISLQVGLSCAAAAESSAVVFMYHRFGEDKYPTTSVRIEQLEEHIAELTSGKYKVKKLPEVIEAMRTAKPLPDRTIAITVDDAFRSVYTEAWPRFRKAGLPFTLFVASKSIDEGLPGSMTWDQIRELHEAGVTIGNHTVTHLHMPRFLPERNHREMRNADKRFRDELGFSPKLFAYPYGETSLAIRKQVMDFGFTAAFGQHSGVAFQGGDLHYLPRFSMNESYGGLQRFRMAANALPLTVRELTPSNILLTPETNPPQLGFTVYGRAVPLLGKLTCYASGQGRTRLVMLGPQRVETRMSQAFPPGRARINCTMPARGGRWRWFGRQFVVPQPPRP